MNYLRSLFLNILVVFFVDRVSPGIEIGDFEGVANLGADLFFSLLVGFLNASIFFFLALLEVPITKLKMGLMSFVVTFGAFTLIAIFPFGVRVVSIWGVLIGGTIVWAVAFLTNYLELKYNERTPKM